MFKITLMAAAFAIVAQVERAPEELSGLSHCVPAESPHSKSVFGKVRSTLTRDRTELVRSAMGLSRLPEDSVVLVTDTATCGRAARAIGADRTVDPETIHPVLVRIGSKYWAEDQMFSGGEWPVVFLLDSTASRVVATH